jgi:type I restriction-modification system DNA methylase subunit
MQKKTLEPKLLTLLINILTFDKEKYFKEHSKTKSLFEQTAKEKQQQLEFDNHIYGFDKAITDLKVLKGNNEKFEFFDWKIDFADLINENISDDIGFDIVIGNPPYITYKGKEKVNISEVQLKKLIENYPNSAEYKVNSYALFIESGLKLLKNNGNINYIIPGSILQNEYLKNIRKHLIIDNNLSKIVAFGNKVFNAVTDSIILIATKNTNQNKFCSYIRKTSLDFTVNDEKNYEIKNWDNGIDYVINLKTNDLEDIILKDIENDCQFIDDFLEVYVGIVAKGIKQFLFEEKVNKNFKKYKLKILIS